jgi:hypothetical protein
LETALGVAVVVWDGASGLWKWRAEPRDCRVQPFSVQHREPHKLRVKHPKLHQHVAHDLALLFDVRFDLLPPLGLTVSST